MMEKRKQQLWIDLISDLADMNVGPTKNVPVKTVWLRALNRGVTDPSELSCVLSWAVEIGLLTFTSGGIANLGSIALTESGFEQSRNL